MNVDAMIQTTKALVAPGKGILAADESSPTIAKRFASIGLESTEPRRRAYREILFTTSGIGDYISGVILFDETIRQSTADGTPFPEVLRDEGVIPGSRSTPGQPRLPDFQVNWSPAAWTGCANGSPSMRPRERDSRSGAACCASTTIAQLRRASSRTRMRSPGMPRSLKKRIWFL
jgi:Fructose-bisphosphate aldolase class-I